MAACGLVLSNVFGIPQLYQEPCYTPLNGPSGLEAGLAVWLRYVRSVWYAIVAFPALLKGFLVGQDTTVAAAVDPLRVSPN